MKYSVMVLELPQLSDESCATLLRERTYTDEESALSEAKKLVDQLLNKGYSEGEYSSAGAIWKLYQPNYSELNPLVVIAMKHR